MSAISSIYDSIVSLLDTTYASGYTKLKNPYEIEENDNKSLNRGYGLRISPGDNSNRQISCHLSMRRDITFFNTIVNRGTERDDTIRETAEKNLLEDHFKLIEALENDPTINTLCAKMVYVSDNGIEQIYGEANNYLMIETTYEIEYLENLS